MKSNIKKILCILLAVAMVFAIVGCGKKTTTDGPDFDDEDWVIDDDTTATASDNESEVEGDVESQDDDKGEDEADDKGGDTGSKTTETTSKTDDKKSETTLANADSLSWSELVAQMPSSLKGKTVTMYSWNPAKHVTGAEKVIANFEKQTGIKVDWKQGSYDNYDTEIAALINSGSSPDIIRYFAVNIYRMDLTQDVVSATGYDFKGDIWDDQVTSAYTVKGKVYGVNLKNTFNQQPTVVYYAGDTIKRYKLEDPYDLWKSGQWTWNKFVEMCQEFKEMTSRPGWMTNDHFDLLRFSGLDFMTFDGNTYTDNSSDPRILTTLQKICSYRESGLTCEAMRSQELIENGTYLFSTDNMLCARTTDFHYETLKGKNDLMTVPFPSGFVSDQYQPMHEYEAYGFPKGCKNGPAAYYFLRYYLNRDNYDAKTFFVNNQALETFDYVMKQKRFYKVSGGPMAITVGDVEFLGGYIRTQGKVDQIQSELDKAKPLFKRATEQANEKVAKFK